MQINRESYEEDDDNRQSFRTDSNFEDGESKTFKEKTKDFCIKRKKLLIIIAIVLATIIVVGVIVGVVVSKSSGNDQPPTPPVNPDNPVTPPQPTPPQPTVAPPVPPQPVQPDVAHSSPYQLISSVSNPYGQQIYQLQRSLDSINSKDYTSLVTSNNTFINQLTMKASLINYKTLRIQFLNANSSEKPQFQVPETYPFVATDYLNNYKDGIRFNTNIGFEVSTDVNKIFNINIIDKLTNEILLTTYNRSFVSMSTFNQFEFRINATRLYGIGERKGLYKLGVGNYSVFSYGDVGAGQHPFIIARIGMTRFIGFYFFNSNAQQFRIGYFNETRTMNGIQYTQNYSTITYTTTGGIIDIFTFMGPSYQDVVRQYHNIIGKPALLAQQSNGFFAASNTFLTTPIVSSTLDAYVQNKIPLDGYAIDEASLQNNLNMSYSVDIDALENQFPFLKLIGAFTSLVPIASTNSGDITFLINGNLIVKATNGWGILGQEYATDSVGFCFDFFNPILKNFMDHLLLRYKFNKQRGIWLQQNTPFFEWNNLTSGASSFTSNPFYNIPFWPGRGSNKLHYNDELSLPFNALHTVAMNGSTPIQEYHYNLHGLFGTQMAYAIRQSINSQNLIISEQTFPGAGQLGIAHVLPRSDLDVDIFNQTISTLMAFSAFGIPNTSPPICGYYLAKQNLQSVADCLKSFQMAFISPFAFQYAEQNPVMSYMIAQKKVEMLNIIQSLLQQRLRFITYTRTQLYKISKNGGAMVRPVLADFPNSTYQISYNTVMYGDALKVEFSFSNTSMFQQIELPPTDWLYMATKVQIKKEQAMKGPVSLPIIDGRIFLFQRSGTIIPVQNTTQYGVTQVKQLKDVPIQIFAVINNNDQNIGHVLIEDQDADLQEYYEIKANNNMMTFKAQTSINNSQKPKSRNIDKFFLAFTNQPGVDTACALLNDYKTIQNLYVTRAFESDRDLYNITEFQPNDPSNPQDTTTISIDQIAFIFYGQKGKSNIKCDQTLLQAQVQSINQVSLSNYQITVVQNLKQLIPILPNIEIFVNIFSNSSVEFGFFPNTTIVDPYDDLYLLNRQNEDIKRRLQTIGPVELGNLVTVNYNPFFINIHTLGEPANIFLTTQNMNLLMAPDFCLYNVIQPLVNSDRMFGLGEREGFFFFQDNTLVSLFTNNNDAQDLKLQKGRQQVFGKNGFFPLLYGQINDDALKYTSLDLSIGSKDVLIKTIDDVSLKPLAQTTVITALNKFSFTYCFNVEIGRIFNETISKPRSNKQVTKIAPDRSYGTYVFIDNIQSFDELYGIANQYKSMKIPFEGFILGVNLLKEYESLTLNETIFTRENLLNLTNSDISLINIVNSGVSKDSKYGQQLLSQNLAVNRTNISGPLMGEDQKGNVVYPDFQNLDNYAALLNYATVQISDFQNKFDQKDYSFQLINNEVTNYYCNGDCFKDDQLNILDNQFYKVGINKQLKRSLANNATTDAHNYYGYLQAQTYWNTTTNFKKMIISSSNTYQSGWLGNVANIANYIDPTDNFERVLHTLFTTSVCGMNNLGFRWVINNDKDPDQLKINFLSQILPMTAVRHNLFNTDSLPPYYLKYTMLKYIKTQNYLQAKHSFPFFRPVFLEYPDVAKIYQSANSLFLFGPSFLFNIPGEFDTPGGLWCQLAYFAQQESCVNTALNQDKSFLLMRIGYITPLQDLYNGAYPDTSQITTKNAKDLAQINIDLHVFPVMKDSSLYAVGQILIDNSNMESPSCLIEMTLIGTLMTFQAVEGDVANCQYAGYKVGKLIIYDSGNLSYQKIKVNSNTSPIQISTDLVRKYQYFDLQSGNQELSLYSIFTIQFFEQKTNSS